MLTEMTDADRARSCRYLNQHGRSAVTSPCRLFIFVSNVRPELQFLYELAAIAFIHRSVVGASGGIVG